MKIVLENLKPRAKVVNEILRSKKCAKHKSKKDFNRQTLKQNLKSGDF